MLLGHIRLLFRGILFRVQKFDELHKHEFNCVGVGFARARQAHRPHRPKPRLTKRGPLGSAARGQHSPHVFTNLRRQAAQHGPSAHDVARGDDLRGRRSRLGRQHRGSL